MKRLSAVTVLLALFAIALLAIAISAGSARSARADGRVEMDGCAAWPGEISPLPTVAAPDPITAQWARERVRALAADARLIETMSLSDARRYWQHVLCLDPHNDAARTGLFRTGPFRVSGPVAVDSEEETGAPADGLDAATLTATLNPGGRRPRAAAEPTSQPVDARVDARVDAPVIAPVVSPVVARSPRVTPAVSSAARPVQYAPSGANPPGVSAPPPSNAQAADDVAQLTAVDQEISEIETLVADAHFATALSVAGSTRKLLQDSPRGAAIDIRRARLEVLSATAAVALGRDADALVSMSDALRADPALELDTGTTSPKVVAIFEEAKRSPRPTRLRGASSPGRDRNVDVVGSSVDVGALDR